MMPLRVASAYALLLLTIPAAAQREPPSFGTGIEVIHLNVSVTDDRNRYVGGLSPRDFAVFEDGVRQDLSLFTHENVPISLSLLLDCSASMDEKLAVAQEAGVRFIQTLRPQDLAQVVQFTDRITLLQDFTSDHAALESAVRQTRASGPTVLYNALYVALKQLGQQAKRGGETRRRAIVLLSDGEDTASLVTDEQVLDLARRLEIAVYAVSLRPERPLERQRIAFSQAANFLTELSRDTGGQVHFPNSLSELDAVYGRIAEELRTQYTLGYVSANPRRDGKWRRIVVRTPLRDDLQVRHKIGYYAPRTQSAGR